MMILIKLGGSVITDKSQYKKFNEEQTARLCKEIADSRKNVIVVHGAGSFGHVLAKRYSLQNGLQDFGQIPAVAQVQSDVRELGVLVVKEMMKAGIPAVSVPPGSCLVMDKGKLVKDNVEPLKALMHIGVMPVLCGDVVTDRTNGFGICSGDQAMEMLAEIYKPEKVIFVSDVDGLYTADPKTNPDAKLIASVSEESIKNTSSELSVSDVTGGIRGKMEEMLKMCDDTEECMLINGCVPGRLLSVLKGEEVPCTIVKP